MAVHSSCSPCYAHRHMRPLLRRNLPHDGGGAVVTHPHQPLGEAVASVQAPSLLQGRHRKGENRRAGLRLQQGRVCGCCAAARH